ncbi:sedolisin-B Serine peptidase. MEROPS family S53 [Dyella sp. OK004]|uniref:protease pro-enzyme activation domain-containing protein n=1 Tax=Dyella sp. OK004 TaxID=1855292 RepID=UPI0008F075FD|nr:RICIN domain-containing protein [Dyella sp. OK004]SFS00069.1 sedolisin-B Serine peptidase. MEROPS family S53 [Dyella sp. OK004]
MSNVIRSLGSRKALLPAALSVALLSMSAHADNSWVSTRTHAGIKDSTANASTLVMTGHPSVDARQIMPLEQSKPLHIEVSLSLRNADQLQSFLQSVNQPGSASYHQFLTPEQFKAQYAPTDAQVKAVVAHLEASGFRNITVAPNNMLVSADGHAANANAAFNANMKTFSFKGEQRYANAADATVPQSLGGIVESVLGLQDFVRPHVMYHKMSNAVAQPQAGAAGSQQVGHNPTDFAKIYDAGNTVTASKTTVGIITWGDMTQPIADLKTFTTNAGMATVNTKTVTVGNAGVSDDANGDGEWALDSQDIVGVSGGVKQLIFYAAANGVGNASLTDAAITAAYNKAVTDKVATVINVSLGEDETAADNSGTLAADDKVFAQAVAQGQTFSVSSGDAGVYQWSNDGDPGYVADGNGVVKIDLTHYSVSEPATSPNVVAVGGTTLSTVGTTAWSGETVWNEGLAPDNAGNERLWATGGGVSLFEPAPKWQTTALGATVTKRQVPDVAFDAAQVSGAKIVINGVADQLVGGTSLASPIFVGIWARIESANNNSLGLPTQNMYAHFPTDAAPLHDVTSGNNGYGGHGYSAKAGYDNSTGWGSLDIAKFNAYVTKYWGGGNVGGTPTANFSATTNGLTATFTDSSTDAGGTITSHAWTFGDNGTSTATSPSHTYAAAGTYSVTETVTDSASGKTSSKTVSVTVSKPATNIIAANSTLCLNVASNTSGAGVIQSPCAATGNELWTLVPVGSYYHLVAKGSGQCLNVPGSSTATGTQLIQYGCQGSSSTNDQWSLVAVGSRYHLVSRSSGLCANINGGSNSAGAKVIQWSCQSASTTNDQFTL